MRPYIAPLRFSPSPQTLLACLLLALGACVTTETRGTPSTPPIVLRRAQANQAWLVRAGGQTVGALVRFQEPGSDRYLYSVRDIFGLDRGLVDAQGRAWRFRPHAEAEWAGSGTIAMGVSAVLQIEASVSLREVSVGNVPALLEASARR